MQTQLAQRSESSRRPSGREPPEIAEERFSDIAREIVPLFVRHWRELAINQKAVPLDVDVARLLQYERSGFLALATARIDGRLVGYVVILMGPHLHHATTKWGQFDGFWLDPEYRKGLLGYRLLKEAMATAKRHGVQVLTALVKMHFADGKVASLFERLGFKAEDMLYSKVI